MSTVQDLAAASSALNASATASAASTSSASQTAQELQDRFLKLLVTQMQNQDPLNPLDNAEVTSQLAQVNTVSGIAQLNSTLAALSANVTSQQPIQAAALVGHGVLVDGSKLTLASGESYFAVNLPQAADGVTVTIKDTAGNTVQSMDVGAQAAGNVMLHWDGSNDSGGTSPDGSYTFSVKARAGNSDITATPRSYGVVNSVIPDSNGTQIDVGGVGTVLLTDVKQII